MGLIKDTVRRLRKNQTQTEDIFWEIVRQKRILGLKFCRQYPIKYQMNAINSFFVADFYCHKCKLIIEIDGSIHEKQVEWDRARDFIVAQYGYSVLRIKNEMFFGERERIKELLIQQMTPLLSRKAEREGAGVGLRHGFSYVEMLVVCSIFFLIVTLAGSIILPLIRTSDKITTQLHRQTVIVTVLDAMDQDIAFADQVQVKNNEISITNQTEKYRYAVQNNRLCRIKNGVLYLTPKESIITDWRVLENPIRYQCVIDHQEYARIVRRRN